MKLFQVADELVAEFADPNNGVSTPDQVSDCPSLSCFH